MSNPSGRIKLGLVQMHCEESLDANLRRGIEGVHAAADQGARIVCLPEMFRSRYFCQAEDLRHFDLAEPIPGPSTEALSAVAKARDVVVVAGLFERRLEGVYHNTAVVLDADGVLVGKYRKMHIPDDPLYYEKYYFTPGDLGFRVFPTRFGRVGVLVCWDQWFPEGARLTALAGAQFLFYPTAIGWHLHEKDQFGAEQHAAWETIQRSHAIANGMFVCAVNRVGQEGSVEFWGRSFVADPMGNVLVKADKSEQTLVVECDLDRIEYVRRNWPFLRDRRIDAYQGLTQRVID